MTPAQVSREVNYLYFLIVICITLTVIGIALFTRNKRAIRMFLLALPIWALIEGIGLVSGMRIYEPTSDTFLIFIFVALVEDSGWVCLGYMMAEQLFKKLRKKKTISTS